LEKPPTKPSEGTLVFFMFSMGRLQVTADLLQRCRAVLLNDCQRCRSQPSPVDNPLKT